MRERAARRSRSLIAAGLLAAGLAGGGATATAAAATTPAAPVIHETFGKSPLPCTGAPRHRSTLQLEGCGEHAVLRSDQTIDGLARTIVGKLPGAGRREFVTASNDWLASRDAFCRAAASPSSGGTIQGVVFVQCLATQDGEHITDLRTFLQDAFPAR